MTQDTRIATVLHRLRLGRRIAELMQSNGPLELIRAAWRVFCRLARATMVTPQAAFAQAAPMNIVTDYCYPGWRAYDADSYDGATDSPDPITGEGNTESEAIADLIEKTKFAEEERNS